MTVYPKKKFRTRENFWEKKQCYICRRTEQEVKALLEKIRPAIPMLTADKENTVMVPAKTDSFRDGLKGIYRCVICECILMNMANDAIDRRTKEDLLTEDDLERIQFEISASISAKINIQRSSFSASK